MKGTEYGDSDKMGIIREEIEIIGTRKRKRILALFDSGAYKNYIKRELKDGDNAEEIGFHVFIGRHRVILANGDIATGEIVKFKEMVIKGHSISEPNFVIMDNLFEDVIIGVEIMQKLGLTLEPQNEMVKIISP